MSARYFITLFVLHGIVLFGFAFSLVGRLQSPESLSIFSSSRTTLRKPLGLGLSVADPSELILDLFSFPFFFVFASFAG